MPSDSLLQYLQPWQERVHYKAPDNPYKAPWSYPEWTARNGDLRAPAERPKDWSALIAEAISPTMGAYGLGQGLGSAVMHGREGDWRAAGGEAALLAAGAIMPGPKAQPRPGIRAYHGSPHDFDKFDMSKIGTGEGAQAFGHGLYFAENEGVAKSYRNALGSQRMKDGTPFDERNPAHWAADAVERAGGDKPKAAQLLASEMTPDMKATEGGHYQRLLRAKGMIERGEAIPEIGAGRLYEVRINADPADFVDWDKPISQQTVKAKEALIRHDPTIGDFYMDRPYRDVQSEVVGTDDALRDAGIPGVRYLDQGSRSEGAGTHNYVLFRDDIIDVVRKYGIAAAASMYGMDAVMNATGQRNALMPEDQ